MREDDCMDAYKDRLEAEAQYWHERERATLEADVRDFMTMPLYRVVNELETSDAAYIRSLAQHLGLSTTYGDNSRKSKGVLAAAIYEHLRKAVAA